MVWCAHPRKVWCAFSREESGVPHLEGRVWCALDRKVCHTRVVDFVFKLASDPLTSGTVSSIGGVVPF